MEKLIFNQIETLYFIESKKIEDFDEYMFGLKPSSNTRNPWFREYWQKLTGCQGDNERSENFGSRKSQQQCGKVRESIILNVNFCFSINNVCDIFHNAIE